MIGNFWGRGEKKRVGKWGAKNGSEIDLCG